MADRRFQRGYQHLRPGAVVLEGSLTIGASGAVGTLDIPGVASATRNGAGDYTFTLDDTYYAFLGMSVMVESTSLNAAEWQLRNEDVNNATTPIVRILFHNSESPPVATDPSNTTLWITIRLDTSAA